MTHLLAGLFARSEWSVRFGRNQQVFWTEAVAVCGASANLATDTATADHAFVTVTPGAAPLLAPDCNPCREAYQRALVAYNALFDKEKTA